MGIFVDYVLTTKGYRVYLPENNKIKLSCDVLFNSVKRDDIKPVKYNSLFPSASYDEKDEINEEPLQDLEVETVQTNEQEEEVNESEESSADIFDENDSFIQKLLC